MGAGIAVALLRVGWPVVLVERSVEVAEEGSKKIHAIFANLVTKNRLASVQAKKLLESLTVADSFVVLSDVDLVIETAVPCTMRTARDPEKFCIKSINPQRKIPSSGGPRRC